MAQAFNYADGLRWFGEGVRALRNRPLGLVGIVVFYVLISGLLSGLPVVGTILAGVWMPFGAEGAAQTAVEKAMRQRADRQFLVFVMANPLRRSSWASRKRRRGEGRQGRRASGP